MVVKEAIEADYTRRIRRSWVGRCELDCGFDCWHDDCRSNFVSTHLSIATIIVILSIVACRTLLEVTSKLTEILQYLQRSSSSIFRSTETLRPIFLNSRVGSQKANEQKINQRTFVLLRRGTFRQLPSCLSRRMCMDK